MERESLRASHNPSLAAMAAKFNNPEPWVVSVRERADVLNLIELAQIVKARRARFADESRSIPVGQLHPRSPEEQRIDALLERFDD